MNRLLLVCLIAIGWCLGSCTDKDKVPNGVLPKDKMEKVLWDVIQAERFRETFIKDSSQDLKKETFKLYAQVFEIHKITKEEFIKSYKFYMSRPDIARDMFDSMSTRATRLREEMYKPKPLDTAHATQPAAKPADSTKAMQPQPAVPLPPLSHPPVPGAAPHPITPAERFKHLKGLKRDSGLLKLQRPKP